MYQFGFYSVNRNRPDILSRKSGKMTPVECLKGWSKGISLRPVPQKATEQTTRVATTSTALQKG